MNVDPRMLMRNNTILLFKKINISLANTASITINAFWTHLNNNFQRPNCVNGPDSEFVDISIILDHVHQHAILIYPLLTYGTHIEFQGDISFFGN